MCKLFLIKGWIEGNINKKGQTKKDGPGSMIQFLWNQR